MRSRAAATLVMIGTLLAACGGGSPGGDASDAQASQGEAGASEQPAGGTGSGTEEELDTAARAAFEAYLTGDDEGYFSLLATDCRDSAGFALVSGHLDSRRFNAELNGVDLGALSVASVTITDFTGSTATVALVIDGPSGDQFWEAQPQPWIHEADGWRYVGCDEFSGQGGLGGGDEGSSADNPLGVGFIGEPAHWFVVTYYITPDFNEFVAETPGNPEPAAGNVYFAVQLSFTYDGPNASAVLGDDLGFRLEAGGATYSGANTCGSYAQEPELDYTAAPGEQTYFTLCWEVPTAAVDSAFVVVTDLGSGTDWWYATAE
jgi:hypothetical protein